MTTTIKTITAAAALAFFMAAGSLSAQITNVITLTTTVKSQKDPTDNGTVTTTPAPKAISVTTKTILQFLAQDEFAEGNYVSSNFPAGAKFVIITGDDSNDFQVLNANNQFLVDVSDIISTSQGNNNITSGKENDDTDLGSRTNLEVITIGYDDTSAIAINGDLVDFQFSLTGLLTNVKKDTAPTGPFGTYTESQTATLSSGVGEGEYQETPFVITGGLVATGKATFQLTP